MGAFAVAGGVATDPGWFSAPEGASLDHALKGLTAFRPWGAFKVTAGSTPIQSAAVARA